jgi:4-carboxymuconolactone decarboxylase
VASVSPRLDADARAIVDLVAATRAGHHRDAAHRAVEASLTAGRRPDQVLELLLHLVPFIGFTRVLRGVGIAREVFTEQAKMIDPISSPAPAERYGSGLALLRRIAGPDAEGVLASLHDVSPDMARILVELTYGDIYSRPGLETPVRLLATITSLVALGDTAVPLRAQVVAGMSWGWRPQQLDELFARVEPVVGLDTVAEARAVLAEVT